MSETALQIEVARWLRIWVREPAEGGPWWTAINPVPDKSRTTAGMSKAMGMKAGVPDLLLVWRGRPWWVELKDEEGYVSEAQAGVHTDLLLAGGTEVQVLRSLEAVQRLCEVLAIPVRSQAEVDQRLEVARDEAKIRNLKSRRISRRAG